MATETYYYLGTKATGINHLDCQTSAPTAQDNTDTGWDTTSVAVDQYSQVYANVVRATGTFGAGAVPTTIDTTNGNGWRLFGTAKSGTYAAGNWTFNFRLKCSTSGSCDAGVSFLVWKSTNADGSGGSAVGTLQVTSYAANINTGSTVTLAYDPSGGAGLTLTNEYVFVLAALRTDPGGTGGSNNIFFRQGGLTHAVQTTDWTDAAMVRPSIASDDGFGQLLVIRSLR